MGSHTQNEFKCRKYGLIIQGQNVIVLTVLMSCILTGAFGQSTPITHNPRSIETSTALSRAPQSTTSQMDRSSTSAAMTILSNLAAAASTRTSTVTATATATSPTSTKRGMTGGTISNSKSTSRAPTSPKSTSTPPRTTSVGSSIPTQSTSRSVVTSAATSITSRTNTTPVVTSSSTGTSTTSSSATGASSNTTVSITTIAVRSDSTSATRTQTDSTNSTSAQSNTLQDTSTLSTSRFAVPTGSQTGETISTHSGSSTTAATSAVISTSISTSTTGSQSTSKNASRTQADTSVTTTETTPRTSTQAPLSLSTTTSVISDSTVTVTNAANTTENTTVPQPATNKKPESATSTTVPTTTPSTAPDPCSSLTCENGGTCVFANGTASCNCQLGFTGANCSINIDECKSNPCQNGGTCNDLISGFNCSCALGFDGTMCENNIDECKSSPCQNGGTCHDLVNGYNCSCVSGFDGVYCEHNIDECKSNPCKNGGTCGDLINGFNCSCVLGFDGTLCEHNINECSSYPCLNGGTCQDRVNGFTCTCVLGFNGTTCENNIDDCAGMTCQHGGTCKDLVNNYTCSCSFGWEGRHCETDINECISETHRCDKFANCMNTAGNYTCMCKNGFSGDGYTCTDIDECSNSSLYDCKNGGSCFNLYGTYACVCAVGWTGATCNEDIDECKTNICSENATCANAAGNYSCSCKEGYREEDDRCIYKVLYKFETRLPIYSWFDDGNMITVYPFQGISYFGKTYYRAYVSPNGFISLGRPVELMRPPNTPQSWPNDTPVIAPLWADLDPVLSKSSSRLQVNTTENTTVLAELFDDFNATYALMATWTDMPPYPGQLTLENEGSDFQVLIASNGTYTRIVFNYDHTRFRMHSAPGRHVGIGYSSGQNGGDGVIIFDNVTFTAAKDRSNIDIPGRWVFNMSTTSDAATEARAKCRNLVLRNDYMMFLEFLFPEPCPCTLAQAWRDRRFRYTGRYDDTYKFQSIFYSISYHSIQHCNYNVRGILLQGAPNGGYPTVHRPDIEAKLGMAEAYRLCCETSDLCSLFYLTNPSDTCKRYRPPSWASGWGDPHIVTLDGAEYTFNGRGEFVFARTKTLEVQVRTEAVAAGKNDATVFVGVAAKESNGDTVEVSLHRENQTADILINGVRNTTVPKTDPVDIKAKDCVIYNVSNKIVLAFPSGFSMQIGVSDILDIVANAPTDDFRLSNMSGLLGNNDGDKTNDFILRNSSQFPRSSSERDLWTFGISWMLQNRNESLFRYTNETPFAFFNNRSIQPQVFITDEHNLTSYLNDNCPQDINQKKIIDMCNNKTACIVDYAITCNDIFGQQTLETQETVAENARISKNDPPVIVSSPTYIEARYGHTTQINITITDDVDTNVIVSLNVQTAMENRFYRLNETTWTFEWNVTKDYFNESEAVPFVTLTATDTMNASTEYRPTIYYCNCTDPTQCTYDLGNSDENVSGKFKRQWCECGKYKTGRFCEITMDPCEENNCYDPTTCVAVGRTGTDCGACPAGLTGNGKKCYDINECESKEALCSQSCENTQGSYKCGCHEGYSLGDDNKSCVDIDECKNVTNRCTNDEETVCVNTIGSYECSCRPGYINESNSCILVLSQFVGQVSYRVQVEDEADVSSVLKSFLSEVFNSSKTGISVLNIEIVQLFQPQSRKVRQTGEFADARYLLNSKKLVKTEIVKEIWDNYTFSSYCDLGLCKRLMNGAGLTINAANSHIYGDNMLCEVESKRCDPVSTYCTSTNGILLCNCKEGFAQLDSFTDRCQDIDECVSSPCTGGTCSNSLGNYTCHCPAGHGFISGACQDLCNSSPCLNNGECIHGDEENSYVCKCDEMWFGQNCEQKNEEASRLKTILIALGSSIGGLCFLLLIALFGLYRRNKKKYESYLNNRAMSSLRGFENSKLRYSDEPFDDSIGHDAFSIPRPTVTSNQYEMRETDSDLGLLQDEEAAKHENAYNATTFIVFDDPSKPRRNSDKESQKGQENPSFLHSESSMKDERRRSKNSYEYF